MRWIRSNVRGLAGLALLALAVQIALTFGHVHLDGASPAAAQVVPLAHHAGAPLVQASGKRDKTQQGTADFGCPICALIQLASTSAPSVAPPLPIPATVGGSLVEARVVAGLVASPTLAFQARGPPLI